MGANEGKIFRIPGALRFGKTALSAERCRIAEAKQWHTTRIKSHALWPANTLWQRAAISNFPDLI